MTARGAVAGALGPDDGVLRVTQTLQLQNGQSLVVRGERVSRDVIACD